MFRYLHKLGIA